MVQYMEKAERMDTLMCEKEGEGRMRRQLDQYCHLITSMVGKYLKLLQASWWL